MNTTRIKLLTEQELMEIFGGKTNWGTLVGSCIAGGLVSALGGTPLSIGVGCLVGVGQDWISQR